ncbi:Protein SYS1 [Grifola frondosa]|uniref:Protein SYS1 n=1 Tax=Grifola frondosa TaxID=5627 RepID=A0A1C7MB34_GRIFR|nr:Protein SYS1 [Grifola frondosa]
MAKSTGWDPVLLISQIVSMQTLHYITLAVLIPPLLTIFAEPSSLEYEGGAANVGMIMDWREMAGKPTVRALPGERPWSSWRSVWSGGKQVSSGELQEGGLSGQIDPIRGWIIGACWLAASAADIYYLFTLIRRPRLILDFSLTLLFNHLVLTTYYSSALPTSLFFWAVVLSSTALMVIIAEQLCVKREMTEGLAVASSNEGEDMEMGSLLPRQD